MSSSSAKNIYPIRLYEQGKAPKQLRSMNHNCYMSNLQMFKEEIGLDAWEAVKNSSVGVIAKFKELQYTWSALTVHYMLTNQLSTGKPFEIWSLILDQPVRFSLHEFEAITGLNCAPFKENDKWDADHREFWEEMEISTAEGPSFNDLQLVLGRCSDWDFEKRRMLGWLGILSVGILGISPSSKIPLALAKRVLDPEAFESYPWGRVACDSLIESIKMISYGVNLTYTLRGCVHVLLIWAFESVHVLGERFGNIREGEVPLLCYAASRPRGNISEVIKADKEANENKVRVKHFLHREDQDLDPQWVGDYKDVKVSNMVEDILQDRLDISAWGVADAPVISKRRAHIQIDHNIHEGSITQKALKKNRDGKRPAVAEGATEASVECGNKSTNFGTEMAMIGLAEMMKALTEKVESMDNNLADKISISLEPVIYAKVDARVEERLTTVNQKIGTLEDDVKYLKERLLVAENNEARNSNRNVNDEASSQDMSWMVHTKATSHDDVPIRCVVKKEKHKLMQTEDQTELKQKDVPPDPKSNSGETWSDPRNEKRVPQLSQSQRFPFVGNSTIKRIISGVTPSPKAYDPFALVEKETEDNLLNFMQQDDMDPIGTLDSSVEFYKKIITPRLQWPHDKYGWLGQSHICAAMHMFHKRSMLDPSPYHSSRIAFLDQWFVSKWVSDYKHYDPKDWVFPDYYLGVFNGTHPAKVVTNKRWLTDVDHLYACHFINDNHWVALDIDLVKEKIHVYDSILSVVKDDKEILNYCSPFTRMIPALLNLMVPTTIRKKSEKQFTVKRLRTVPQNEDPDDCGVYALKYIECLAIGCTFEGLSDRSIQRLRFKFAAEIFSEVAEPDMAMDMQELRLSE